MPSSRLSTIPYGVDLARFVPQPDHREELLGVGPDTFVVGMVAYVYAPKSSVFPGVGIKGHDVLLEAWTAFTRSHPDSLLVLVGGGFDAEGESHRQRLIEQYGVDQSSTIQWFDSVEDVRPLYSSADLSVSPSLSENHGAALEASSMSLPSIVSDAGGLPETVTGATGWVVPAGEVGPLLQALNEAHAEHQTGALARRGRAARDLMQQSFSIDRCVREVASVVLDRSGETCDVVAFTEQRTWLVDGEVVGRKALPIVTSLARGNRVTVAVRVGALEPGGTAIAPGAAVAALSWPSGRHLPTLAKDAWSSITTIVRTVRRSRVVYADQPGLVGGIGLVIGHLLRRPLAVNVVGDSAESVHPRVIPGLKGRLAHAVLPRLQSWACSHATVANYVTARVLQERYPATRATQTFAASTVVPLGPARPRSIPQGRPVSVVTIASLEQPYKGVSDLVDAMVLCRAEGVPVTLTVVGAGRLGPQLEAYADKVAPGLVTFRGHLYGQDVYDELGNHDVFALASWTEGLPRALIEAMADGMPAVATSVGGVPELLEPARTCPPREPRRLADRLVELMTDPTAWDASVAHNLRASHDLFEGKASTLDDFVSTVAALAGRPQGAPLEKV